MGDITLRSYAKGIEVLIELERLDEAIAHCRHILQIYPKHVDSYRLLGKAYLEAKRFGEASDIFQRVLSAEPTDYLAHVFFEPRWSEGFAECFKEFFQLHCVSLCDSISRVF